ncbi:hypothetical protein RND71_008390 [Anisodus tanguticus]|uniref:Uncharacterized protein n=1 Tax=Anisodus tanguticus TaxID=243964 RepID=A0AAE1SNR6_9SOLA|nr:hypothetical protein RND71_008390 [Anisodus tanguticus]
MIERVLANQERTDKSMKGFIEVVGYHTASIQKLESLMRTLSREQHPQQRNQLLSAIIPNPKNCGGDLADCHAITTRSGKLLS